jgi:cellulose synthase/poly-beta-1,6-N-acetylglucosamine synthase-like glycosyltransferase
MPDPLFLLALATVLLILATFAELLRGNRLLRSLRDVPPWTGAPAPVISVVIPARNEERHVEEALQSVLAQDWEPLEIVVVDDRSTDRTGAIIDRMAVAEPRLRIVHVTELPPGWLGKNHAMQLGAEQAAGELLLFTDADVVLDPTTLRRAVAYLQENQLDNLTVAPEIRVPGVVMKTFVAVFSIFFAMYVKPWKARDPRSPKHVGIGAFNLVRTAAWRAAGTHRAIAMRPDDDLKLGKLLKKNGFRQDLAFGGGLVSVEWYHSVRELVDGLMKNAFAGVDYRIWVVVLSTVLQLAFFVWPFAGVFLTDGPTRLLNLAAVALLLVLCWVNARLTHLPVWTGLGFPFATVFFLYIVWRSMILTLVQGGIRWRGTLYPLKELKANKV